jgi:hypothetical protein
MAEVKNFCEKALADTFDKLTNLLGHSRELAQKV